MDNDRYSPSGPAAMELPEVDSLDMLSTISAVQPEVQATSVQADVQEAISNLQHIDDIETELEETANEVADLGHGIAMGEEAVAEDDDRQEEDIFHDATAHEAELERELEDIPSATGEEDQNPLEPLASSAYMGGSSEDAEGEIDMDLGADDEGEASSEYIQQPSTIPNQTPTPQSLDPMIDPDLMAMELPIPQVLPEPTASVTPVQTQSVPQNTSEVPAPRQRDPRSASPGRPPVARRPPGLQRRSPSYSLEAVPAPTVPPPGPRPNLPEKPSFDVSKRAPFVKNEPRSYAPDYDFEGVEFPEGITANSMSVKRHLALASSWKTSKDNMASSAQASLALFEAARSDGDVEGARAWYQVFSNNNPTAVGPMLDMINFELAHGNFPQVVALYEKALRGLGGSVGAVPGVDIWRSYLHYIRRQNPVPAPGTANASSADAVRETVVKAYELALKEAGQDVASGPIWREYIGFLGEKECTNTWEAQTQQDALRKVYHRAVVIPLSDVEQIWREYDAFENKLNKMTAKKFLAERSPLYMTARTVLRDLKTHIEPLVAMAVPPRPTRSEADRALVINWKKYLKWEESNPLDIEEPSALQSRVGYALRRCLTQMRFFPELWHQAAVFYQTQDKGDEAVSYLKTGLEANPTSFLLTFALAEQDEIRKNNAAARAAYEGLIKSHGSEIDKLKTSISEEVDQAKGPEIEDEEIELIKRDDEDMDGAELSETQKRRAEREARGQAVVDRRQRELEDLVTAAGVIWIMFMRFARRAEGLKAARAIFSTARRSPYVSWHIFESAAQMEYHCNKDSGIATKIFELGLKAFPDDVAFAVNFLEFQIQINDDSNARALFERLVLKFPADKARPIWDAWSKYEYLYGDLGASQKLEARIKEAYPTDAPLRRFASRFLYNGIDEIASRDLGFGVKREAAPAPLIVKRARPDESPLRSPRKLESSRFREPDRLPLPPAREPPPKRQRGFSPPRRNNRPTPPEDDRRRRDFTPPQPRRDIPVLPPVPPPVLAPGLEKDASGLPRSVVWFLGNLPRARLFDGPTFVPEDFMNVLSQANIPNGPPAIMANPGPQPGFNRGRY